MAHIIDVYPEGSPEKVAELHTDTKEWSWLGASEFHALTEDSLRRWFSTGPAATDANALAEALMHIVAGFDEERDLWSASEDVTGVSVARVEWD